MFELVEEGWVPLFVHGQGQETDTCTATDGKLCGGGTSEQMVGAFAATGEGCSTVILEPQPR